MATISTVDGMDVSALRLFLTAIEFGSVSQAARRMNVTQPSATAKLQKLERQLGAELLERSRVGSRPTDVGSRLAPLCAEVIAAVEGLVDRAEAARTEREVLTVAATRHVADHFLPEWLGTLDLDDLRVDLIETSTRDVARAVRNDRAAIGFSEGPHAPIGLGSRLVASEQIVPVVGRGHTWWTRRRPLPIDDLATNTIVLPAPGSGTRDVVVAAIGEQRVGDADVVEVANSSSARLAALAGGGVAFLPRCWTADAGEAGTLRPLPLEADSITKPVRVVWRGTRPATAAARRLVDQL